jgi:hypothetical protein
MDLSNGAVNREKIRSTRTVVVIIKKRLDITTSTCDRPVIDIRSLEGYRL